MIRPRRRRRPSGPRGAPGAAMRAQTKVREGQDLRGRHGRRRRPARRQRRSSCVQGRSERHTAWASGEYSTLSCFESSQSGSSSIGMLGPRMECPGSPYAARGMTGKLCLQCSASICLHLSLGGASLAATWGAQWRITFGDAVLNWQRAASSNFFFRKGLLLCEHVERRKGKRRGGKSLRIIGTGVSGRGVSRGLDAFVSLHHARVRVLEVDERAR
jgi:hypothetical protein